VRCVPLAMLLGAMSCENRTDAEQKTAPSAMEPKPIEVPMAQPPKLTDQAVLPPPSLSPDLLPGAASATAAAKAVASAASTITTPTPGATPTATANPKAPADTPGVHQDTTTPGPMAPRTPRPVDTM
jgi:hypothetical protein